MYIFTINYYFKCVAFVSFIGFASIQTVVAVIAQSEAMLGDSAAMVVDSMTYGFNLYAEKKKKKNEDFDEDEISNADCGSEIEITPVAIGGERNETTDNDIRYRRILRQRKRHLHLELMPPVMSVSVLLVVIGLVLHDSIHTLIIDAHRSEKEQSRPNLVLMMTFSVLNLVLDLVNVFCFARAKHLMGYKTDNGEGTNNRENDLDDEAQYEIHDLLENCSEQDGDEEDDDDRVNLNMCSAYTVSKCCCIIYSCTLSPSELTHIDMCNSASYVLLARIC